jgi:hypothetical protein
MPALVLLIIGMLYSTWLTSFSQFVLAGAWVFRFDWKNQIKQFWQHTSAVWISALFFLYLFSLLYSSDYQQGFNEVRILLPVFLLPFLFSGLYEVTSKQFRLLIWFYVIVVFTAVLFCIPGIYYYYSGELAELRDASRFISHIRLSLHVCLVICILSHFISTSFSKYWLLFIPILILVLWLFLMQALTGLIILFALLILSSIYFSLLSTRPLVKTSFILAIAGLISVTVYYIKSESKTYFTVSEKVPDYTLKTSEGNQYTFNEKLKWVENGSYIFNYLCESEIEKAWAERSTYPIDGLDAKGQPLKQTLIRFLNSKGLYKDAQGVRSLSAKEISCIEKGIANMYYINPLSIKGRLYQVFWELEMKKHSQTISNHGIIGKANLWKTAIELWSSAWILGVGVGDLKEEFSNKIKETYPHTRSDIRVHNQYLTIGISTGLVGLVIYFLSVFKIVVRNRNLAYWPVLCFYFIVLVSMLTEDTLNTQAGLTFYAFFLCFFSFFPSNPETTNTNSPLGIFDSK